jgi:hypothetical protein
MILVALLTENEKNQLVGQKYTTDSYFNPIQDIDNNWIISVEEINYCTEENFEWVKDLPLIEWQPIQDDFII